jgi:hypothetical protein
LAELVEPFGGFGDLLVECTGHLGEKVDPPDAGLIDVLLDGEEFAGSELVDLFLDGLKPTANLGDFPDGSGELGFGPVAPDSFGAVFPFAEDSFDLFVVLVGIGTVEIGHYFFADAAFLGVCGSVGVDGFGGLSKELFQIFAGWRVRRLIGASGSFGGLLGYLGLLAGLHGLILCAGFVGILSDDLFGDVCSDAVERGVSDADDGEVSALEVSEFRAQRGEFEFALREQVFDFREHCSALFEFIAWAGATRDFSGHRWSPSIPVPMAQ